MSVIRKIAETFMRMWEIRDELRLRNIRVSHLQYTLAMPMCLGIGNMMSSLFRANAWLLGLDPKVTLYCAYLLGAFSFYFIPAKRFKLFSRIACVTSGLMIMAWLVLRHGELQSVAATVCWFALGGCVFCAFYVYMRVINNTERFFGAVLIVINYGACFLLDATGVTNAVLWKALPLCFLFAAITCILLFQSRDMAEDFDSNVCKFDKRMYPAFALFFIFFLMDAFISFMYIRGGQAAILRFGIGAVFGAVLVVLIQLIFKRSIWHVWNLYFILLVVSFACMQTDPGSAAYLTGSFLCGLCTCGYAASFYTFGGVMKKFGSFPVFQKAFCMFSLPPLIVAFLVMGYLQTVMPEHIPLISIVAAGTWTALYVLFSPVLQKGLFTTDWVDDYNKSDMTALAARIEQADMLGDYHLTPREKEICTLLLAGYSRKQIGSELKISYPTVGFHCTALYKKLKINSLSELFIMFGHKKAVVERGSVGTLDSHPDN